MFLTDEEIRADKIYEKRLLVPARHMIANAILSGCRMAISWNKTDSSLLLPKTAYYQMAGSVNSYV